MTALAFQAVSKRFGDVLALDGVSLAVEPGTFTVVCGPPRSGKSTLFRLLVGLDVPDQGTILLEGRDITREVPGKRAIGYVPQSFALYPHLTVRANIAYPLTLAGAPAAEIAARVDKVASMLSIGHLMAKTPDQLSGGEKQRVAVARGLMREAKVFVLDDPLVGLDYKLRERLMDDLKELCRDLKATFLYATSDSLEALTMAERLVVLDAGRVVEEGDTLSVYDHPSHIRSLELVGFPKANVIAGTVAGREVVAGPFRIPFAAPAGVRDVFVGIRPEMVRLDAGGGQEARVSLVEHLGSEVVVHLDAAGAALDAAFGADKPAPAFDSTVRFAVAPAACMIFDAASGRLLGRGGN